MSERRFQDRMRTRRANEILAACEHQLVRRGCIGLTIDDVAPAVGIAKGTVYLHFPGRDVLILTTLRRASERVGRLLQRCQSLVAATDPIEFLGSFAKAAARLAATAQTAAGRRCLAYPCCFSHSVCPYAAADGVLPLLLERVAALDPRWRKGFSNPERPIRPLLFLFLGPGEPSTLPEREHYIDLVVELLRRPGGG
jgi:AcrR family transcriptional regulator